MNVLSPISLKKLTKKALKKEWIDDSSFYNSFINPKIKKNTNLFQFFPTFDWRVSEVGGKTRLEIAKVFEKTGKLYDDIK